MVRLLLVSLVTALLMEGQVPVERVPWSRTPEVLANKYVSVRLNSGTRVEGSWASVAPTTFTMKVSKTTNRNEIPKGLQVIPRSSLAELRAGKRRIRGRVLGTIAGFYGVALIGTAASSSADALQGPVGIAAFAGGILGFFVGRAFDHAMKEIVILPDARAGAFAAPPRTCTPEVAQGQFTEQRLPALAESRAWAKSDRCLPLLPLPPAETDSTVTGHTRPQ